MYNIGIDLGGTNIKVGLVDENYNIVAKATAPTNLPRPAEEIVKSMVDTMWKALNEAKVTIGEVNSIGIGTPGVANRNSGTVLYSCNLGFKNTDLRALFGKFLNKPLYVENDANAAAFGEVLAGAGKGYKNVVVVTLGTGVGGGIIIEGKIYTGFNFCGAELGHTVIEYNGRQCACGRKGCFEAYSSATGLVRMTAQASEFNPDSILTHMIRQDGKVSARTAYNAMKQGDPVGKAVTEQYIKYLSCGIANAINIFQPDILCIGGGVCNEGDTLLVPLRAAVAEQIYSKNSAKNTEIVICSLGNDAGIIGAAMLFKG